MMFLGLLLANLLLASTAGGFVVEYFASRKVAEVTFALCGRENDAGLCKEFSRRKIRFDFLDLQRPNESRAVRRLTSTYLRHGVLLDSRCPGGMNLLKTANEHDLFASGDTLTHWLVLTGTHISKERLEILSEIQEPKLSDPIRFLTEGYEGSKSEKRLLRINKEVNWEFISTYKKPERRVKGGREIAANETEMGDLLKMNILLDDIMALAVPGTVPSDGSYALYAFYKATSESRTKVEDIGRVERGGRLELRRERRKRNFDGAVLRAGSALFQADVFTTMWDLATRDSNVWPKLSYPHVRHLAEDLNFRMIIRFTDNYGWPKNGTFLKQHLMGLLQQKAVDFSASVALIRPERMDVVDFMDCPFHLEMGILFREPPLSSVSNVFLLPFSKSIWISVGVVVVLAMVALRCRIVAGKALIPPDENVSDFLDVANYVVGAVCQQGFPTSPKSLSARTTVLIVLLTSLALFTSYSACIVALLQSSSSAITTIEDLTRSNLEVGIQMSNPFYKVLIQEAVRPAMKEFYARKVLARGEKAFCGRREGIERMRTGLFAFEVELSAGYKLISETYQEREKCGIRKIDPIPQPLVCMLVRKASPYREVFAERFVWQRESGLFDRTWKLWMDQKPKCEVGRIGFFSVGLTEFGPALLVFVYGVAAAALVFFAELLQKKKKTTDLLSRCHRGQPSRLFRRKRRSPRPSAASRR